MAPEQLRDRVTDRRTDVYAASIVLWEMLTGKRLFHGTNHGAIVERVLMGLVYPPSKYALDLSEEADASTLRGLDRDPTRRFQTALEMAKALEQTLPPAPAADVARWMQDHAAGALAQRAQMIEEWRVTSAVAPIAEAKSEVDEKGAPTMNRRGVAVAAAGFFVVVALVAAGRYVGYFRGDSQPARAQGSATLEPADPTPLTPPTEAEPASVESSLPPAIGDKTATTTTKRHAPRKAPSHPAPAASDPCRVPYTVDANGVKTYKRNCL
jgi:serine/threonine-protein kinase